MAWLDKGGGGGFRIRDAAVPRRVGCDIAKVGAACGRASFRQGAVTHRLFAGAAAGTARCANARLALRPVGAATRKRLFSRAARKQTALYVGGLSCLSSPK